MHKNTCRILNLFYNIVARINDTLNKVDQNVQTPLIIGLLMIH